MRVGQKHNRVDGILSAVEEGAVHYTRMEGVDRLCLCATEASHCSKRTVFIIAQQQKKKKNLTFHILIFYGGVGTLNGLLTNNDKAILCLVRVTYATLDFSMFPVLHFNENKSIHWNTRRTDDKPGML